MFKVWAKNIINLVYPLACAVCGERLDPLSARPLCDGCWQSIKFILPPFCRCCGKHLPASAQRYAFVCSDCQQARHFFKAARSACAYEGVIKECIHLLKYAQKFALNRPLSALMIGFAQRHLRLDTIDLILPVPLHQVKLRERQFNQATLLARTLAKEFSRDIHEKTLVRIRNTPSQTALTKAQRLKNVAGAFSVRLPASIDKKRILLIDDVFTTGATVGECAKVLTQAGARSVEILTLARSTTL
ncbi:MAG: ComF family protein [Candidatus Omnitrophota bacterium]